MSARHKVNIKFDESKSIKEKKKCECESGSEENRSSVLALAD